MSKIVIITGGSEGIGFATAQKFCNLNYKVLIASRNKAKLALAKAEILQNYSEAQINFVVCDVAQDKDVTKLFKVCDEIYGKVNILINAAAILESHNFIDANKAIWQKTLDINLKGTISCCEHAFQSMSSKGGVIINMSSLGGVQNFTKFHGYSAYVTSKSAITGLTEALAVEGKEFNIRVNAIAPGAVATNMLKKAAPELKTKTTSTDIADTIIYLCNNNLAKHINGTILTINSNE